MSVPAMSDAYTDQAKRYAGARFIKILVRWDTKLKSVPVRESLARHYD